MKLKALIIFILFAGCSLPIPGGPGSIESYDYQTTKDKLEKTVMTVIKNNKNIYRDTTIHYMRITNTDNGKVDSTIDNYYNDGKNYFTIKIKLGEIENEYTFRFYGDEEYWRTSPKSEIFIVYAYDKNGRGGCESDGRIDKELKEKLLTIFESEFISKIDKELNLTHTESD